MKTHSIKNILVPVDFSRLSRQAIEMAKDISHRFDAAVHLVHVHESYYPVGLTVPPFSVPAEAFLTYHQDTEKKLRIELGLLARKHGVPAENCHLLSGTPAFHEVCTLAHELPADLIVMPTHAYKGMAHLMEGSTAERMVQHAPCPVWVARPSNEKRIRPAKAATRLDQILVPVDFSNCSLAALEYAIDFAERCASRLIVFHAVHLGYAFTTDGYAMYDMSAVIDSSRKEAEAQLRRFVALAKFRRVEFETVVRVGPPVSEVCAVAEERDVDLIITATHGRTGFKHLLVGSVAEQLVRYAPRPVLVVPSHPEMRVVQKRLPARPVRKARATSVKRLSPSRRPAETEQFTKRFRKVTIHPSPERRLTNKFRQAGARALKK
jgi:nucleotide-binding universal stress UspA family protein